MQTTEVVIIGAAIGSRFAEGRMIHDSAVL
jgi:hypothetical protein